MLDKIGDFCIFISYLKKFTKWYNPNNDLEAEDKTIAIAVYNKLEDLYNAMLKIIGIIQKGGYTRLSNLNMKHMDLSNSKLDKIELNGANFYRTNLTEANLRFSFLQKAILKKANLEKADMYQTNLQRANLESANLEDTNLDEADLSAANLRKANLKNAKVTLANLSESHFEGADIRGADFTHLRDGEILRIDQENPPDIGMDKKTLYDKNTKTDPCFMILLKEKATFIH